MRQVYHNLCTYSADLFGINSALYELGGLIVMHDASGCNSTYNTHDEPRWYTMDSMVYVSGLNEKDAILGNDQRLIDDICAVAIEEQPKFVALSLSVLPAYMGTDVRGIARLIEKRTGIPTFGFATNGMDTYVRGAGMAFRTVAQRFCSLDSAKGTSGTVDFIKDAPRLENPDKGLSVNLLGVTPLDFSVNGNVEALEETVRAMGVSIQSNWAMGSTLEDLHMAPKADVNLVVSVTGLPAARYFQESFGLPYVIGIPCGESAVKTLQEMLVLSAQDRKNRILSGIPGKARGEKIRLIGEPVHCASLRFYLEQDLGYGDVRILCPFEEDGGVLRNTDAWGTGEEVITAFLNEGDIVIADPVYRRVVKSGICFVDDPHDAYSGRMYHDRRRLYVGQYIKSLASN